VCQVMMIELLTDFHGLKKFIKESDLKFKDALVEYYRRVGEEQGFTILKDSSVIKNAVNYGRVDLVWVESNTVFCSEFSLPDDIYRHLFRIMVLKPSIAVLLLSGASQLSPQRVKQIVGGTPQLEGIEFVILDVSSGKII
jgi:hypothetical protein